MTIAWTFLLIGGTALAAGAAPGPDAFQLWKQGAFRGANVMGRATVEDMRALRSWGANLAEIAFGRVSDSDPPYQFRADRLTRVDRSVEAAEAAGLFVVLTCRSGPGRANFDTSFEIWHDEAAQAAYVQMWRRIAEHYRGRPSIVGYDLMCEPHPEQDQEKPSGAWNKLAKLVTAAIREVDKQTPILVNSTGYGYPHRFTDLEPTGDPRTVYAVHMYSPRLYTHQKPEAPVPYPGVVGKHVEPEQYWDKATIEKTLAAVRAFEQRYKVPVFAGEFGCARWAPGAEQYLRDEMDLYEKWGWSWAYWALREWDAMDIEKKPEAADRERYAETPLLKLFKGYFAKDTVFFPPSKGPELPAESKPPK